jgi:hypothetical protein
MNLKFLAALLSLTTCTAFAGKVGTGSGSDSQITFLDDRCLEVKYLKLDARKLIFYQPSSGKTVDGCWWLNEAGLMTVEYPSVPSFGRRALRPDEMRDSKWDTSNSLGRKMQEFVNGK